MQPYKAKLRYKKGCRCFRLKKVQLADLASKNRKAGWLLDEYHSTEKHANTALMYVLQHGMQRGYFLSQLVKLVPQPTALMSAYAASDSTGTPLIYVNAGLRFFLRILNYSLATAAFKNTVLGGQHMSATLFAIVHGYWPHGIGTLSEMQAMGELSEDEIYFITAWIPSQILFVVAHEFAYHFICQNQQSSTRLHKVRLLTGKLIEVYNPSQDDELRADEIAFDIWDDLDSTLSSNFQALTAGGLGALLGYFRILEEYTQSVSIPSDRHSFSVDRYKRLKARLSNAGKVHSLQAMEETWTVTELVMNACL
jgi:hypothetical protein